MNDYYSRENKRNLLNDYLVSYASDMRLITHNDLSGYNTINSEVTTSALSGTTSSLLFEEVDQEYVLSLYDIKGTNARYPSNANEIALVVGDDGLSTTELASLGIDIVYKTDQNGNVVLDDQSQPIIENIQYDDVIGKTYKLLLNDAYYNTETMLPYYDFSLGTVIDQANLESLYNNVNTIELTITCVLTHKEDTTGSIFSNGLMYTHELAQEYRNQSKNSAVVQKIRSKYLDRDGNFIDGAAMNTFAIPYVVNVSEVSQ